jgi:hypothetical protein
MANREFIQTDIIPMCEAGKMRPGQPIADNWREISGQLIIECQNGVKLLMGTVHTVGRKPLIEIAEVSGAVNL